MVIKIPFLPISVNQAYATDFKTRRRFKTKTYEDFKENLGSYLIGKTKEPLNGDIEIEYNFYYQDKRKRDMLNLEKVMTDCLVYYRIIEDDSLITRMVLERYYNKGNPCTVIEIKAK